MNRIGLTPHIANHSSIDTMGTESLVNKLVLVLPGDPTTKRSLTTLEFWAGLTFVGKVKLSHTEASFVYYLGMERQSHGSKWLDDPGAHKKILKNIDKALSLKLEFMKEIDIENPAKQKSNTWIWDTGNSIRRGITSKIHGKMEATQKSELDFRIIVSTESETKNACYQLSTSIKDFELKPPS